MVIGIFLITSAAPFTAKAFTVTLSYDGVVNSNTSWNLAHLPDSDDAALSHAAEIFQATEPGYLHSIFTVTQAYNGYIQGTLTCELRGLTGTYGSTAVPNSTVYATATLVTDAWLYNSAQTVIFEFDRTYYLEDNTQYSIVWYLSENRGTLDATHYMRINGDNTNAKAGNAARFYNGAWEAQNSSEAYAKVYVTSEAGDIPATPGPLPTGGLDVDTSDADAVMNALIGYGVPVVVMLLPTIFIWLIGGRGKWPMLIGIAIGAGIGFVFGLVPIWLVFLIAIGEIGLAYSDVTSGNGMT